jgi:hypothetical protein
MRWISRRPWSAWRSERGKRVETVFLFFFNKSFLSTQLCSDSAGHGDGVPDNHGDARGILEKRDTTPATV